jgi:hypothetical protein
VSWTRVISGDLVAAGIFDEAESMGWLLPWSDPGSRWGSTVIVESWGTTNYTRPGWNRHKLFALDALPQSEGFVLPDDANKRRWNLRLIAYECGQHHMPSNSTAQEVIRRLQYEPRYYDFYYRHYETLFSPGPAPVLVERQPDGYFGLKSQVVQDAEPLFDLVCDLSPIGTHIGQYYWGVQQFNGEQGTPRARALRDLVHDMQQTAQP